jgi:hypothetical protein
LLGRPLGHLYPIGVTLLEA